MPYYCTVPRCTSMAGKAKNVSFHQFPRDEELAKLWNKILKRGKPYTKYSKVCSLHFTPEDYTITSVGKNKGQWRTLRKDAIPSQNLPSESPTPYQRKQWGSWTHNAPATVLDPTVQQQVAQAIYMQTMLAMQAVGAGELPAFNANGLHLPTTEPPYAHTSQAVDTDILKGKHTNTSESTSYKCTECSKCFKDPDVFVLHKRTHIKNEKNEKENFNLNLTLQANPILANLLKTNTENANIFDSGVVSVENLLMSALAANMEGYMRSFTSMIKNEGRNSLGHDRGTVDHDNGDLNHDNGDLDHDNGDLNHDNGDLNHDNSDRTHDNDDLDDIGGSHHGGRLNHDNDYHNSDNINDMPHRLGMSGRGFYVRNRNMTPQESLSSGISAERDKGLSNPDRGIMDRDIGRVSRDRGVSDVTAPLVNGHSLFGNRILELCTKTYINSKEVYQSDVTNDSGNDASDAVTNDSQGSDGPICDSDLNESIDSSKLVIDEDD